MTPEYYLLAISRAEAAASQAKSYEAQTLAFADLSEQVDALSHDERRTLRERLQGLGCTQLLRSLYFDYQTQVWI